eukprot:7485117-Pyramimonas_sp.AAC.1
MVGDAKRERRGGRFSGGDVVRITRTPPRSTSRSCTLARRLASPRSRCTSSRAFVRGSTIHTRHINRPHSRHRARGEGSTTRPGATHNAHGHFETRLITPRHTNTVSTVLRALCSGVRIMLSPVRIESLSRYLMRGVPYAGGTLCGGYLMRGDRMSRGDSTDLQPQQRTQTSNCVRSHVLLGVRELSGVQ